MAHDKNAVRQILDKVKAEGRAALTAPEGKLVCDAYGIAVPKGQRDRLAFVTEFVEEAKASGFLQRGIDELGLQGVRVAPPAR